MKSTSRSTIWKAVLSSLLGDVTIWYDYALYAELMEVWVSSFLPEDLNRWVANIWLFAAFAAGFLMRPVGSIVFGTWGDKISRRSALVFSIVSISFASVAMTILPTYESIGFFAPVALLLIRLLQGFALGGESGNAVFLAEHSPPNRRTFFSSMQVMSAVVGMLLSGSLVGIGHYLLSPEAFASWGWRMLYLVGALLGIISTCARLSAADSEAHARFVIDQGEKLAKSKPLKSLLTDYKRNLALAVGVDVIEEVALYIFIAFFGVLISGYSEVRSLLIGILVLMTLIVAFCADYFDRTKIMMIGGVLLLVSAYPVVWCCMNCGFGWLFWVTQIMFMLVIALTLAPVNVVMLDLFPIQVRYTGFALARSIAAAVFGGMTPVVSAALFKITGNQMGIFLYLVFTAVIGLIALIMLQRFSSKKQEMSWAA